MKRFSRTKNQAPSERSTTHIATYVTTPTTPLSRITASTQTTLEKRSLEPLGWMKVLKMWSQSFQQDNLRLGRWGCVKRELVVDRLFFEKDQP